NVFPTKNPLGCQRVQLWTLRDFIDGRLGHDPKREPSEFRIRIWHNYPGSVERCFCFWFLNINGKINPAPRTGSGKVNSHSVNLALPLGPLNTGVSDQVRVLASASSLCRRTRCSSKHWAVLA